MNFDGTEEQRLLAASIERFIARDYSFEARRRIVASEDGYSRDVWKTLADLGLLGLSIPSDFGGLGGDTRDLASVMEAVGGALMVEPLLATMIGAHLIAQAGSSTQKNMLLPRIAMG